ncbi:XRE family transcriptional regulator [Magnetospirillum sp. ME-1]|uniref:helix-turn-helix domain-containing protein n=1 Tax=Magnetospirillum sp. ME-1 TaxID=1639348 RepID=UPI000A17CA19|nr:helix-turn-helix transcriptional regulator [Magnetospirillum sp. ME-1]ARJ64398.1 XRE family transcriptional regulator [Magnetospirillum sp. ME-1]
MQATRQSSRGRTPGGRPNPIDVHVGGRLRLRRTLLGLSQEALGEALGLTFQQIQKYERGVNRIGASRLYDLARALDVPVEYFYDEMPCEVMAASPRHMAHATEEPPEQHIDPMSKRETLDLVRTYYRIGDPNVRKRVYELARALAVHTGSRRED